MIADTIKTCIFVAIAVGLVTYGIAKTLEPTCYQQNLTMVCSR